MAKGDVHVTYRSNQDQWAVQVEGSSRACSLHDQKDPAESAGRQAAMKNHSELLVHNRDGTISERNTYKWTCSSSRCLLSRIGGPPMKWRQAWRNGQSSFRISRAL